MVCVSTILTEQVMEIVYRGFLRQGSLGRSISLQLQITSVLIVEEVIYVCCRSIWLLMLNVRIKVEEGKSMLQEYVR